MWAYRVRKRKKTEEKMLYSLWKCNDRIFCSSIWLIVNPQTGFELKLTLMTREWVQPPFLFFVKNSKWKIVKIVYRITHTSLDIWVCQTYAKRRKNQVLGRNMGREIKVDRHTVETTNTTNIRHWIRPRFDLTLLSKVLYLLYITFTNIYGVLVYLFQREAIIKQLFHSFTIG